MRPTPGRIAVVVIGLLVLAGMVLAGTRQRTVSGYDLDADGRVVQVRLTCGSILDGGGVVEVGAPTGIEVPQDERLEQDPGLDCPEEGATWQAGLAVAAVLVVAAVVWAWQALGDRSRTDA